MSVKTILNYSKADEVNSNELVIWTFDAMINSDFIFFNFDKNTDPVSLLNFGIFATSLFRKLDKEMVVYYTEDCPYGPNIEFICNTNYIHCYDDLDKALGMAKLKIFHLGSGFENINIKPK